MKSIILACAFFMALQVTAQDTTKVKPKEFLGVLTLTDNFKVEKNWTPQDQAIVGEHFQRLKKFRDEGVVVLAGRTDLPLDNPDMVGLVIFYAKDEKEALKFMQDDPAVKNKIMQTKVHPYGIALIKCQ